MANLMSKTAILDHPYLVYKNNSELMSQISGNLVTALPNLEGPKGKLISIIEAQMQTERAKEEKIIDQIQKYLKDTLLNSLLKDRNYSQMITLFDAYKKGIIEDCKNLEAALSAIDEFYKNFKYTESIQLIEDFFGKFGDSFLNQNVTSIFDQLNAYIEQKYEDSKIQNIYKKSVQILKNSYFKTEGHLKEDYVFKKGDLMHISLKKSSSDSKTVMEELWNALKGTFGGLPLEVATGGVWTGTLLKGGKNPDTDAIVIFSKDLNIEREEDEQSLGIQKTYEEMREIEKKIEDCYIIHYSVKSGGRREVKLKGEASYAKRIEEIKFMFESLNISDDKDFIFTLANTIPDMAADDRFDDIKNSLIQLTTLYMFDDILPSVVEGVKQETYNTDKLNFYNINGRILTASEIFNILLKTTDGSNSDIPSIISLTQIPKKIDYKEVKKGKVTPEERWNAVYDAGMNANKISRIMLNAKKLIDFLLEP